MSFTIGRLGLDDPESFPESVGEPVARVGATPVPGGRRGLSTSAGLTSFPATTGDTAADRQRVRRQLRSLVNNLPMRLQGVYVAWSEDDEQNGWYVPGSANFDVADVSGLTSSFWRFTGVELALVGRRRTHRRATAVYLRDLRDGSTPRDYLKRIYSTDFSDQTALALTWLPSAVTDVVIPNEPLPTLSTARNGYGGATLQAIAGTTDLQVVSYDQAEADRNLGDVVIYDRRGTLSLGTNGPTAGWEEVYGPDYPLSSSDVPVIENSLARVSYSSTNTDGFLIDRWGGSTWVGEGKVLIERITTAGTFCNTLVSADVVEWSPDRGVVRAVMEVAADAQSREEIYITMQRGWSGPRFEVYPAQRSGGTVAGAGIHFYSPVSPAATSYARKEDDAGLQTTSAAGNFTPAAVGASTFNDENWLAFAPGGGTIQVTMAVVQAGASGRVENGTDAYGSARNGIAVELSGGGYISAHLGMVTTTGGTLIESSTLTYLGSQDLGQMVLYDSRSPQTIVSK